MVNTVLVVEDDEDLLRSIQKKLRRAGFNTEGVLSGSEAIQRLAHKPPALVLLDYKLPDMTGKQVIEKTLKKCKNVPFIILTGYGNEAIAVDMIKLGARDYLVKETGFLDILTPRVKQVFEQLETENKLKKTVEALQESEQGFRATFEQVAVGIAHVGLDGRWLRVNQKFCDIVGYSSKELIQCKAEDITHPHDLKKNLVYVRKMLAGKMQTCSLEKRYIRKNGSQVWINLTLSLVYDSTHRPMYFISVIEESSERKKSKKNQKKATSREYYLAYHDALTGLPNRQLFYDRLKHAVVKAKRYGHKMALLFLDLDKFKPVNDAFGHNTGDILLKLVTQRLCKIIRESDTVARLAGDEFTIVLEFLTQARDAAKVAQKILKELSKPFIIDDKELNITTSIGISIYPNDGADNKTLVRNADLAMFRAKNKGANRYQFYNNFMAAEASNRVELEKYLQNAVKNDELTLHYQPQLNLKTNKIVGYESLLRWQHPELGLLKPAKFFSLAEETGLSIPIGEWVFHMACKQNRSRKNGNLNSPRISVNVSSRQFRGMKLNHLVTRNLQDFGLVPNNFVLEITESNALQDVDYTYTMLNRLKELGVQIAIDDFGMDYASLSYLKQFPFDILKIDRAFIKGLSKNHDDWAVVSAIIDLAHKLNLIVLAEGVENAKQVAYLQSLNCDEVQGFYFSRPIPFEELPEVMEDKMEIN